MRDLDLPVVILFSQLGGIANRLAGLIGKALDFHRFAS
jgi:hypothetical protein